MLTKTRAKEIIENWTGTIEEEWGTGHWKSVDQEQKADLLAFIDQVEEK